jgi:hypothetical protein
MEAMARRPGAMRLQMRSKVRSFLTGVGALE